MLRSIAPVVLAIAVAGCSSGTIAAPSGTPAPDPAALESEIRAATTPPLPQQASFDWLLEESGSRINGRGVVRVQAPDRARLDLFGPRGETYLTAALVDGDYRLPAAAAEVVSLPTPALLWSAFGVLDPPDDAVLSAATTTGTSADLRYQRGVSETFAYEFSIDAGGAARLMRLERAGSQGIVESVTLERDGAGNLVRTHYRNWSAFRDLTIDIESVRDAQPFPPSTWSPDGTSP